VCTAVDATLTTGRTGLNMQTTVDVAHVEVDSFLAGDFVATGAAIAAKALNHLHKSTNA